MKIIIEIQNEARSTQQEVRYTLMDALAEFQSARTPTGNYIDKRYPEGPGYVWMDRPEKARQVNRRKRVAEEMRNNITVEG